jgi:hypothetical protein
MSWVTCRQLHHRTPTIVTMEQRYGSDGLALLGCVALLGTFAAVAVLVGALLLILAHARGSTGLVGYLLIGLALAVVCWAGIRYLQVLHMARNRQ